MSGLRILLLEDSELDAELLRARLEADRLQAEVERVETLEAFAERIDRDPPDVILSDYLLPTFTGMEALELAAARLPDVPFIFVSGALGEDRAVESLKLGATDYVLKDRLERLVPSVRRALGESGERAMRRAVEAALRDSERRLRIAIEAAALGTWEWDPDSGYVVWSERAGELLGLEPGTGAGTLETALANVHPEDRERVERALAGEPRRGTVYDAEFRVLPPEAEMRWVSVRGQVSRDPGGGARVAGVCMDATERVRTEEVRAEAFAHERRARVELETAGRAKDEFLAMVSHELRTPLNSMLGWVRLLRTGKLDEAAVARAVETIERNVRSQAQLIEDLLDVSRIISGKLRVNTEPVLVSAIVEAALDTVRPAAEAKSIALSLDTPASLPPVLGDPERLQQVVWNLLSNAVKFTPSGRAAGARISVEDGEVEVAVWDAGQGIPAEFLPYVFDPFRQADGRSTRVHKGLGLGLAIVRHLVELHGGTVTAESEGGDLGSTFRVRLPVAAGREAVATAVERDHAPVLGGVRVLVVDDEPDTLEMLAVALAHEGATVVTAASAKDARGALDRDAPDVLVSDVGMPQEDGYSLIRSIRERPADRGGAIPAVALTAFARAEDRVRALAAGFQMHVAKPVEPAELAMTIKNLVGLVGRRD